MTTTDGPPAGTSTSGGNAAPAHALRATLRFGVVGVTDLDRSLDFYRGGLGFRETAPEASPRGVRRRLLESEGRHLMLEELLHPAASAWVNDDLQLGMRHIGFKVDDIDAWAERVRAAGAVFIREPFDAFGDVRIAFFLDPDGTHLELVQRVVRYTDVWSPVLARAEAAVPAPQRPRFDHVALSVGDLTASLALYRDALGFDVIGQLEQRDDPRAFLITYVMAGEAILELFSFGLPLQPNPWHRDAEAPGLLRVGLGAADPAGAVRSLVSAGAVTVPGHATGGHYPVTDADGTPYEVSRLPTGPVASG